MELINLFITFMKQTNNYTITMFFFIFILFVFIMFYKFFYGSLSKKRSNDLKFKKESLERHTNVFMDINNYINNLISKKELDLSLKSLSVYCDDETLSLIIKYTENNDIDSYYTKAILTQINISIKEKILLLKSNQDYDTVGNNPSTFKKIILKIRAFNIDLVFYTSLISFFSLYFVFIIILILLNLYSSNNNYILEFLVLTLYSFNTLISFLLFCFNVDINTSVIKHILFSIPITICLIYIVANAFININIFFNISILICLSIILIVIFFKINHLYLK